MEFLPIVMAAGEGSRFPDLTERNRTPKALIRVGNFPLIYYPLHTLWSAGFEHVVIFVKKGERTAIERVVSGELTAALGGLSPSFVSIPKEYEFGTAGSLLRFMDKFQHSTFLVLSCDFIGDVSMQSLADVHRRNDADVTLLLAPLAAAADTPLTPGYRSKHFTVERDVVGLADDGRVVFFTPMGDLGESVNIRRSLLARHVSSFELRTDLLDAHVYLISRRALRSFRQRKLGAGRTDWSADQLDERLAHFTLKGDFLPWIARAQFQTRLSEQMPQTDSSGADTDAVDSPAMGSHVVTDWVVGQQQQNETTTSATAFSVFSQLLPAGRLCIRVNNLAAYMKANRLIDRESLVGTGCELAEQTSLKKSVVGQFCKFGSRVKINNSVILDHVTVEDGANINDCILLERCSIGAKCHLKDCLVRSHFALPPQTNASTEVLPKSEMEDD